ncbi:MAG: CvpA family protein [Melioribacteraceae bacterium]|jgi:membrane protein required for colicin V production|nr:CvpA family protein [Melioribacteraceae bacterium]
MNYIDFIIIFFLFIGFALGFRDGLVRKAIGLIGLVFGIVLALEFYQKLGILISPYINDEIYLAEIVAWLFLFIGTIFLASILKRIIHPLDKVNRFTNQLLGGISGTFQILFFISGFILFLNVFNIPDKDDQSASLLYNNAYGVIPYTIDLIIGEDSEAMNLVKDFIDRSSDIEVDSSKVKLEEKK